MVWTKQPTGTKTQTWLHLQNDLAITMQPQTTQKGRTRYQVILSNSMFQYAEPIGRPQNMRGAYNTVHRLQRQYR